MSKNVAYKRTLENHVKNTLIPTYAEGKFAKSLGRRQACVEEIFLKTPEVQYLDKNWLNPGGLNEPPDTNKVQTKRGGCLPSRVNF